MGSRSRRESPIGSSHCHLPHRSWSSYCQPGDQNYMLNPAGHRGFTLVEIMLALVVTLIVTGAMYNLLLTTQRLTRTQSARVALQSSVRAGALIVVNELSELNTVSGGSA